MRSRCSLPASRAGSSGVGGTWDPPRVLRTACRCRPLIAQPRFTLWPGSVDVLPAGEIAILGHVRRGVRCLWHPTETKRARDRFGRIIGEALERNEQSLRFAGALLRMRSGSTPRADPTGARHFKQKVICGHVSGWCCLERRACAKLRSRLRSTLAPSWWRWAGHGSRLCERDPQRAQRLSGGMTYGGARPSGGSCGHRATYTETDWIRGTVAWENGGGTTLSSCTRRKDLSAKNHGKCLQPTETSGRVPRWDSSRVFYGSVGQRQN